VKYPFKKLDVVAVPDFAAGAMENTAAIFYRETLLLADSKNASNSVRKEIGEVLAHEMAHQWFGDLVTMRVGRHLVERGIRQLDGDQAAESVEARVAHGTERGAIEPERDDVGFPADYASDSCRGVDAGGNQ